MVDDAPRQLRRKGIPGRRQTDAVLPVDWTEARDAIDQRLREHDDRHDEHHRRHDEHEETLASLAGVAERLDQLTATVQAYVDDGPDRAVTRHRVALLWAGYVLVIGALASGAAVWGVRTALTSAMPPRATVQAERLAAIGDVLDVPRDELHRTRTGVPRTAVVQRRLDELERAGVVAPVRGVTAREVQAACLQVPVCGP